jgi:hypothetical protein
MAARLAGAVVLALPLALQSGCSEKGNRTSSGSSSGTSQSKPEQAKGTGPDTKPSQTPAEPKTLDPIARVRLAAQRARSANNLKQIALAFHIYNDNLRKLPASAWIEPQLEAKLGNLTLTSEQIAKGQTSAGGRPLPLLSWRVALLPFLEEEKLYRQFKLDEPWDSAHNKKLLAQIPQVYAPVTGKGKEEGLTYYQVFVGRDAPFNGTSSPRIPGSFPDGLSRTFLVVEAGQPVPWTKPADLAYDGQTLPALGGLFADGFNAAFGDGAVSFVARKTDEKTIRALITPRGGELVDPP